MENAANFIKQLLPESQETFLILPLIALKSFARLCLSEYSKNSFTKYANFNAEEGPTSAQEYNAKRFLGTLYDFLFEQLSPCLTLIQ